MLSENDGSSPSRYAVGSRQSCTSDRQVQCDVRIRVLRKRTFTIP